jgi:hypothetical protein
VFGRNDGEQSVFESGLLADLLAASARPATIKWLLACLSPSCALLRGHQHFDASHEETEHD